MLASPFLSPKSFKNTGFKGHQLACPGRRITGVLISAWSDQDQATATKDFDVYMSYL